MYRLFETIKINNGQPENIDSHNKRLNGSRKELYGCADTIDLRDIIIIPDQYSVGSHKCKVVFSTHIHEIIFQPYQVRTIKSLKAVYCNDIEYTHKYVDRERINELFLLRDRCDDILIVKNGRVTDTSFSNIAFYDGTRWITPRSVLLEGTKREQLMSQGVIMAAEIGVTDIASFKKACLINAMLELGETTVEIENIII